MHRRRFLVAASSVAGLAAIARPSAALTPEEARAHVRDAVDAVLELVKSDAGTGEKAERLRKIFDRVAAMPQIARFAAGVAWRDMSQPQQSRFTEAFVQYLSRSYARRFQEYSGGSVEVDGATDAGRRGLLVKTTVVQPDAEPVKVEWMVSDRPGRIVIADIIIEGVSLLITQREEISAMLEKRNGNIDKLIADLASA